MDAGQDSCELLALEKALLDETMDPTHLPLSLLKDITMNFSDGQEIGRGGFGAVYKGKLANGMIAVKKLFDWVVIQEENFQSEVDFLVGVRHKNTVRLLGYCSDTQCLRTPCDGKAVWAEVRQRLLCFELLRNGSLANYISDAASGLHWTARYEIIRGICEGVHYLHQQRIIHMDLKPQNVLLDDNMMPKISDFGLSRRLSENQSRDITKTIAGSCGYMAPEFIISGEITLKTDIYSIGAIIMEVLMGSRGSRNVKEVLESWRNGLGTPERQILLQQVKECAEIAILCMDDDPEKRPTTWDIIIRIFDEEEISNWSDRGAQSTSSIARVNSLIDKLEAELNSKNLNGRPFPCKRVSALKTAVETSTEIITNGLTHSELLDVHPLELRFPFEANKPISCALSLTNKADRCVFWMILPEQPDMFLCEKNFYGIVRPKSTSGVIITMVKQQQRQLNTHTLCVLMITSESPDGICDLLSSINSDDDNVIDLPKRIEEQGGQMRLAMVTALVCPQSEVATPKIIFTKEHQLSVDMMDVHPTEPWILMIQNRRKITIWNYQTQEVVMSFKCIEKQGRARKMLDKEILISAAKFIPKKQWFVTGHDSGKIRVYSYLTRKEVKKFAAYFCSPIRCLAVHPTYPLLISLSESLRPDHAIRLWNWDKDWKCVKRISKGVASVSDTRFKFNPSDTTQFAGGSGNCHVWSIHSSKPSTTIWAPDRCLDSICDYLYRDSIHRPYLITSAEAGGVRVCDLQTKSTVHTLVLQDKFIGSVACHPTFPLIVAGSRNEDQQIVCFWNGANYRLLKTVQCTHGGSIIDIAFVGSTRLVIGYAEGIEVMEIDMKALADQQ